MSWNILTYLLILGSGLLACAVLLYRMWKLQDQPGAIGLFISILAAMIWSFFYFFEIIIPDLGFKILAAKMQFLGITAAPVGIFIFSLHYSGQGRWVTPARTILLSVIPAATVFLSWTNEYHSLIWSSIQFHNGQTFAPLHLEHGIWFWGHVVFSYFLLLACTLMVGRTIFRRHVVYRAQSIIMLVGLLAPWLGNIFYITGTFHDFDPTPLMFIITNLGFMLGITRFSLLSINPVAYTTIMNAMQDGLVVLDQFDRIIEINRAAEQLYRPEPPFIGRNVRAVLPFLTETLASLAPDATLNKEISYGEPGNLRCCYLQVTPARALRGQINGRVVILTDITAQKQALHQMSLQATAMEAANNTIIITDRHGIIQWVNPAFSRLTGYTPEEAIGQPTKLLKSGEHSEAYYNNLWSTIQAGQVWQGDVINRRKDGSLYYEEMSITPLVEEDGRIEHFIAIKQDVTQRRMAEEALKVAHKEALEASRMKSQMLANVSHELRTPLGAVIGYVEMLRAGYYGGLSEEQVSILDEVYNSSAQLLEFVNNLIGQAQVETGKVVLKNQWFHPAELLSSAQAAAASQARRKGIGLETDISPDFPDVLLGDPFWLQQIIQNLVTNAIKFTNEGKVVICFFQPDPLHWAIQVSDSGVGIPAEAQSIIFEPFKQVDGSVTRRHGGSGLGLSIVRELSRLMRGSVELKSEVGKGSTFMVTLPIAAQDATINEQSVEKGG